MIRELDRIKFTTDSRGCIIYYLPLTHHRESFIQWKQDHRTEIEYIHDFRLLFNKFLRPHKVPESYCNEILTFLEGW
jgi:hypothetical protein